MKSDSLGVVFQFTDCHVFNPDSGEHHQGIDTNASLLACMQGARQIGIPDLLVFSGDLSNDETLASYRFLADAITEYFPDVTCLIQPGNHDSLPAMQQVFPHQNCQIQKHFRFGHWAVYMLETYPEEGGWFHAKVFPEVYQDLDQLAAQDDIHNVLVFMHYNLIELEFRGIECGVTETNQLRQAMLDTGKVRCVSSGHIHQEYHWLGNGIIYTSTPTTGVQSRLPNGEDSKEWIGFKRFELFFDGSISMDTQRICAPLKHKKIITNN